MDALISKLLCIYAVILTSTKPTAALRILVTKQSCGEIVDLAQERNLYLDYEGAHLGGILETCEIKIQNSSPDELICIKSLNPYFDDDMDCVRALRGTTCYHFNRQPRCDRARETRAEFHSYFIHDRVRVNLHIYLGKDSPAPTTTRYTTNYWSSWSSWSSNNDDNTFSSRLGIGAVIGIIIGVISLVVICSMCIVWCNAKAKDPDPRYSTVAVQYQAAPAGLNYPQQSQWSSQGNRQYTSNPSSQPLINTSAMSSQYPGYQIHPPVYQSASCSPETCTYPQQMSNIIPSAPPEDDIPDVPPPAYPGY